MGELKQAIDKFADGGELREFAEEYRSPVSTFDGPVLKMLAGSLSAEGVAELRRFVPVPENHAGARRAIDRGPGPLAAVQQSTSGEAEGTFAGRVRTTPRG